MESTEHTAPRTFPLGVVLTITSGRLLCKMDDVYEACSYLAGEPVWTHQLPRVSTEATQPILEQYPQLADVVVPDGLDTFEKVDAYLDDLAASVGSSFELRPLGEDHTSVNPLDELSMLRPDLPVIPVVVEDPDA